MGSNLKEIHDAGGDKVVSIQRRRNRAKSPGLPVDMRLAAVYTLRDGQETRTERYAGPVEGRKAAGAEE